MTEQGDSGGKLAIKDSKKTFAKNQNANGVFAHKELIELEETSSEFWTGRRIRAIFSMDDTEFSQFHQEIERLSKGMPHEGEGYVEPINEIITVQNANGKKYQYDVDLNAYMHGEILSKTDVEKKRNRIATREKEQANGRNAGTQSRAGSTWAGKPDSGRNTDASGRGRRYEETGRVGEGTPRSRETGYSSREPQTSQSKNVDNAKPTSNPDIRYSIKDEAMSDRMLLANTLFTAAQNDAERRRLNNYKAQIDVFDEIQDRLVEAYRWWDSTCAAAQATSGLNEKTKSKPSEAGLIWKGGAAA